VEAVLRPIVVAAALLKKVEPSIPCRTMPVEPFNFADAAALRDWFGKHTAEARRASTRQKRLASLNDAYALGKCLYSISNNIVAASIKRGVRAPMIHRCLMAAATVIALFEMLQPARNAGSHKN
jgi:tRNA(Leu) C34 or U34 (ribose-2'-O)-methylase TrmL